MRGIVGRLKKSASFADWQLSCCGQMYFIWGFILLIYKVWIISLELITRNFEQILKKVENIQGYKKSYIQIENSCCFLA